MHCVLQLHFPLEDDNRGGPLYVRRCGPSRSSKGWLAEDPRDAILDNDMTALLVAQDFTDVVARELDRTFEDMRSKLELSVVPLDSEGNPLRDLEFRIGN